MPNPDEPDDPGLIREISRGSHGAFTEFVGRHRQRVFRLAFRFAQNDGDLDDLCQEVFLRAYRCAGQYRADAPVEHWLSRIATRVCLDWLRARKRRPSVSLDALPVEVPEDDTRRLDREEARQLLEFAFQRMKPEERLVLTLLELEERSIHEIAALTGWSEGNVKVRASRARHTLAAVLKSHHEK